MNTTQALYFSIHNTTSIDEVTIDNIAPNVGDIVILSARLINASASPCHLKTCHSTTTALL